MELAALEVELRLPIEEAELQVREALAKEGFGVLTFIDVAATLREKLKVERSPLRILGACNPSLAHRALEAYPSAALVLPCNVVLEEVGEAKTKVSIADPRALLPDESLKAIGEEAAGKLASVISTLRALSPAG